MMIARVAEAMISRQRAIENMLTSANRMKMLAVPNSVPAATPSSSANLRVFSLMRHRRPLVADERFADGGFFLQPDHVFRLLGECLIVCHREYLFDGFEAGDCFG